MEVTVRGWMTEAERQCLKRLAFGKRVLEIGSYEGLSTISMAQTARHVTAVDTFDGRATPEPRDTLSTFVNNLNRAGLLPKLRILQGTAEEMLPMLAADQELYDLIFIDSDHSYVAVKRHIELALPLLSFTGVIAFHDYDTDHPGVIQAVDEFRGEMRAHEQCNSLLALTALPEPEPKKPIVYVAMPHRDLSVHLGAAEALHFASINKYNRIHDNYGTSLLPLCFNTLYCNALNARTADGATHFAMLHNDVVPCKGWLDILMEEMDAGGYDMVSAIVPLKNSKGLTSTGLGTDSPWNVRRLTMTEVFELPETFTADDVPYRYGENPLVLNTGCWLMKIDTPWADSLFFRQQDEIAWSMSDQKFAPQSIGEDWDFSRQLHSRGCRIAATRKVPLFHERDEFHNHSAWGEWTTDEAFHNTERIVAEYHRQEQGKEAENAIGTAAC
jgi:predicted O-methyltransferase YrrM